MLSKTQKVVLYLAAAFYVVAGWNHFRSPDLYVKIIPPGLPWRMAAVYVTGVAEIAGGLGLLIPALRRLAAWGLVALLVAVLRANVYMAAYNVQVAGAPIPQVLLWLRLPLQALLIWWVLWCTTSSVRRT